MLWRYMSASLIQVIWCAHLRRMDSDPIKSTAEMAIMMTRLEAGMRNLTRLAGAQAGGSDGHTVAAVLKGYVDCFLNQTDAIPLTPSDTRGVYLLFFDGGSRGNPGPGGTGSIIVRVHKDSHTARLIWAASMAYSRKDTTNNFAEYWGLIHGLREAQRSTSNRSDGIFGRDFEALSSVTNPSLFASSIRNSNYSDQLSHFFVHINPLPGYKPSSQLLLGGVDASLVGDKTKVPSKSSCGFWSLRLQKLSIHLGALGVSSEDDVGISQHAVAIVNSGTSLLWFLSQAFHSIVHAIETHLSRCDRVQIHHDPKKTSGSACTPEMFPSLMFMLSNRLESGHGHHDAPSQRMVLQGLDYIRCDGDLCTQQLGAHSIFKPHLNGAGASRPSDDVVLLGAIFLRTCYSIFDVGKQQIGSAHVYDGDIVSSYDNADNEPHTIEKHRLTEDKRRNSARHIHVRTTTL
ncbi:Cathepsin-like aspartic protease a1, partial [Globisporangium splendens]